MHRSGTSCLAGCLEAAGLHLGAVNTKAPYNAKGNRENRELMDLHDAVLAQNGGAWDSVPENVNWNNEHNRRRNEFLERWRCGEEPMGFKDPRTILTLNGWLDSGNVYKFIGTFRNPMEVAGSLHERNGFSIDKGLKLWCDYNERLIQYNDTVNFPILNFNWTPRKYKEKCIQAADWLGLPRPLNAGAFYEQSLVHQNAVSTSFQEPIDKLYGELITRSKLW